jgi:hypothetical protein
MSASTAATTAATDPDRELLKPFRLGLLGVGIVFVLLGGLLSAYGSGAHRPEGVAERWLSDVGDTRRDGVKEQSRDHAEEVGPVSLAAALLPAEGTTDGRTAFIDLEVGKASKDGADGSTRVPFRLHQRIGGKAGDPIYGTVVLVRQDGRWRITKLEPAVAGIDVPSEGGRPAAKASLSLFAGAIGVSLLLAFACAGLVRAAGPPEDRDRR